ncbi:MAG: yfbG [Collimonas fungivorans]|uniref:formyltransferase family protein n=1 Tax=Collimonas fungivorans TaxID=158899 RepID=UPI0026EDCD7E|nr:formyltransferase family protein [Collimonas fungivorans]MDB5767277.1 yfbG [Collimonas fungivorans]
MKLLISGKSFIGCHSLRHARDMQAIGAIGYTLLALPNAGDDTAWEPSLRRTARQLGVDIVADIAAAGLTGSDIFLSVEYDRKVRIEELGGARAYNLHLAALPGYRGCLNSAWPLRNGESTAAATLHQLTEKIDAGPVIAVRQFQISAFHTAFDLYLLLQRHGFELVKEQFAGMLTADHVLQPQAAGQVAFYARDSIDFQALDVGDFERPACVVDGWVRSLIFPPRQLPRFGARAIRACECIALPRRKQHRPGEVAISSGSHAVIACGDGYVRFEFEGDLQ